jgi:glycosyltransferase involved in cell wall biosynthesis
MVSRVSSSVVTTKDWVDVVASWGGRADLLHEAPGEWDLRPVPERPAKPVVLVVGIFGGDEPVAEVLTAAASVGDVGLRMTGDVGRLAPGVQASAPDNVSFVGFLGPADYRSAVYDAHVVLTLTTEPTSVMRAACEAVFAGRPLIVTDWPVLREFFPHAIHVHNDPADIARGIRLAVDQLADLAAIAPEAAAGQHRRWQAQLAALRERLGLPADPEPAAQTPATTPATTAPTLSGRMEE